MDGSVPVAELVGVRRQGQGRPSDQLLVTPGAVRMRCCGAQEEDENSVDWGSATADGYLHWSRAECRL